MVEHECPRCHTEVELPLGALCDRCGKAIEARARRTGNLVSIITTVGVGLYVYLRLPPGDELARTVGMVGIVMWFVLTNTTVRRIMREYHR